MISSLIWPLCESNNCSEEYKQLFIAKNFFQIKEQLDDKELRTLSVELLNSFLGRVVSSDHVKSSNVLTIDMDTYFSIMVNLPTMELFFDQNVMCSMDDQSVCSLEIFFSNFIDYIMSNPRTMNIEIQFVRFCILSWRECFVYRSQQLLGDIISNLLIRKIAVFIIWFSQGDIVKHDNFSVCLHSIVLASIFRLVNMSLSNQLASGNTEIKVTKKLHSSKSNVKDLGLIYQQCLESLSESAIIGPSLQIGNLESILSNAFKLSMHFCGAYEKLTLKEHTFDELVPKLQNDPTLHHRLTLGYASFLARFLNLLTAMERILTDFDLPRLQRFVQSLISVSGQIPDQFSHTGLIVWSIDRGLCVKDYALAFLRNPMFNDALCSSKVLPRLIRQVSFLTDDSDVTFAVICKLNHLRRKILPISSHEDLLKELLSVLSPEVKTEILNRLQNKSKKLITPLPSEENKFRSYLRTFFNRLSAGPGVSDVRPASKMSKLWRDNASSNTVSKEILLSADMLLLTRPLEFLSELVRFPIIQNSMALLPVLYKILSHVSYAFTIVINGSRNCILYDLVVSLLERFDSDVAESREVEDSWVWRGENRQRMELMRYLPRSGDLDPGQISLANEAAKFSFSTLGSEGFDLANDDGDGDNSSGGAGEDSMAKSAVRKLWIYAITCLLDQPASWPHLSELVNDESSVLSSRKRAELFAQCLALILLPRPPTDIPLDLVAPQCLRLLEKLRSPLAVRLCAALLSKTSGVAEGLQNVLTDPADQGRRLFIQSIDCLPANLVQNAVISLPPCLTQSKLVDVNVLNDSAKKLVKLTFKSSQTSTSLLSFTKPLTASDFEEVLQLVALCDGAWSIVVNHIRTAATQNLEISRVWATLSAPILLLALQAFLHRVSLLEELDATQCWARAMGFVDQMVSGGLISLPFQLRSADSAFAKSQSIYLGTYCGTLDLFDFTFSLLRLFDVSSDSSLDSHIMIGRLCQTLAVLSQRLITRLRGDLHEAEVPNAEISTLSQQGLLLIAEVKAYIGNREVPANSPLNKLFTSLDIVESSLSCQREAQREDGNTAVELQKWCEREEDIPTDNSPLSKPMASLDIVESSPSCQMEDQTEGRNVAMALQKWYQDDGVREMYEYFYNHCC